MIDYGISYKPTYRVRIKTSEFLKRFQVALDSRFDRHGSLRERTKSSTCLWQKVWSAPSAKKIIEICRIKGINTGRRNANLGDGTVTPRHGASETSNYTPYWAYIKCVDTKTRGMHGNSCVGKWRSHLFVRLVNRPDAVPFVRAWRVIPCAPHR